ncbi:MAG: cytochrome D1 domain-containing protein [Terriglobales bacterium]
MKSLAFFLLMLSLGALPAHAGTLLVANNGENTVALLDDQTGALRKTLPTGEGPHEIAVSPDGRFAYIADSGAPTKPGNTVTVLDLAKREVAAKCTLGEHQPHDLRVSADGKRLWAACAPTQSVVEIDAATGAVRRTWKTGVEGGWMLTASPNDRTVLVAHLEGGGLSLIDVASGKVTRVVTPKGEMGFDVAPDGGEVWTANSESSRISVVDARTGKVLTTFPSGGESPVRLKFTPDGKRVLVPTADKKLVVFDVAERKLVATVALEFRPKVMAVSGDGRQVFVGHPSEDRVSVVDLTSRKVVRTIPTGRRPDGLAWVK